MTAGSKGGGGGVAAARAAAAGPRTVLITGVSRGLGRALALELARRGHAVVGCGRSADHVRSLEAEIAPPARHFLTVADVVTSPHPPQPLSTLSPWCLQSGCAWIASEL